MTVAIAVRPVAIHSSLVDLTAALATGVEPTPALMQWLLAQNPRVRFGMLSLSDDGEVGLSHSLVGDSITSEELQVVRPAFVDMAQRLRRSLGSDSGCPRATRLGADRLFLCGRLRGKSGISPPRPFRSTSPHMWIGVAGACRVRALGRGPSTGC